MADDARPASDAEAGALRAEIVRLNKVVDALMDRCEASMNVRDSDFSLFQTTIMLQDQVRLHTEALEATLRGREAETADSRESAAQDMQTLRRTAALQIQLLELVVQEKDVGELIERVAAILDIPIVLFDARGRVMSSSRSAAESPGIARRLWTVYESRHDSAHPLAIIEDAGDRLCFRDILVMDRIERVLAAVTTTSQPIEFAGASLMLLQQLVALDLVHRRDELRMRRRVRRGLLRDVLTGDDSADDLRVRLEEQGFDRVGALRIASVEPAEFRVAPAGAPTSGASSRFGGRLLNALDAHLSQRRVPFLTLPEDSMAIILTTLPDEGTAAAHELLADLREAASKAVAPRRVVVGCSAPLPGLESAPRCLQQAKAACMAARRAPSAGGTAVFDELSGHLILLDGLDHKALTDIVERTFAPVLEYDAAHRTGLYKTLFTLFEHHMAVQETADVLHIHRNTLQKRLAHVEELLGIDLDELDDIVDIRLGLQAAALLGRQPA